MNKQNISHSQDDRRVDSQLQLQSFWVQNKNDMFFLHSIQEEKNGKKEKPFKKKKTNVINHDR